MKQEKKLKNKTERRKCMILNNEEGITLIALVVTIVVLIILATISINVVFSDTGIVARAEEAAFKAELSQIMEEYLLGQLLGRFEEDTGVGSDMPIKDLIRGYEQYAINCQDGIYLIQFYTKQLTSGDYTGILQRMNQLLNELLKDGELDKLDKQACLDELNELMEEINRIANETKFNGILLLNENKTIKVYDGKGSYQPIQLKEFTTNSLNLSIDISTTETIQQSINSVTSALTKVENEIQAKNSLLELFENRVTDIEWN